MIDLLDIQKRAQVNNTSIRRQAPAKAQKLHISRMKRIFQRFNTEGELWKSLATPKGTWIHYVAPSPRKWDEVTPEQVYINIQFLRGNHNPALVKAVLGWFLERMQDREMYDKLENDGELLDLMILMFKPVIEKIVTENISADVAIGLKPGKGKSNQRDNVERGLQAAALVTRLRRNGATYEDAIRKAAKQLSHSESTIRDSYKDFNAGVGFVSDELLDRLIGMNVHKQSRTDEIGNAENQDA
jgi:hypothetical protein